MARMREATWATANRSVLHAMRYLLFDVFSFRVYVYFWNKLATQLNAELIVLHRSVGTLVCARALLRPSLIFSTRLRRLPPLVHRRADTLVVVVATRVAVCLVGWSFWYEQYPYVTSMSLLERTGRAFPAHVICALFMNN